jgi:nicotinamide-nucleotide amidase
MHAIILSIGDELTLGQTLDTNSQWLAARLVERSVVAIEHRTLADDRAAIAKAIVECAARCGVLVVSGGLGPTDDDLTREALGDAATPGEALVSDPLALKDLQEWFARRARSMPAMNARQAMRPRTFRSLANPNGTAPGLAGVIGECLAFALPGPPREMQPMFRDFVIPALPQADDAVLLTARVQEFGMGESVAAEKLGDLMRREGNPLVGTTASDSIVSARIRAHGPRSWAQEHLAHTVAHVCDAWSPYAFAEDDGTLAQAVGELLMRGGQRLATAESCTGGWLGKTIVDRAGSSAWYAGGWVTYSNEMKMRCLDVPRQMLQDCGAVSREVAQAMADGALQRSGADCAIAITGIAGPDGGSSEKPVGTVYVALAGNFEPQVRRFEFPGERSVVRDRAVKAALQMLRLVLIGAGDVPLIWEATRPVAPVSR